MKPIAKSDKAFAFYKSPLGVITMVSDGTSLTELWLIPSPRRLESQDLPVFEETRRWLDRYFQGEPPGFTPPLKPQGTPFQQKVWQELRNIPYGQTTSYGAVAQRIGCRSAQAVGQAIHRNPIPILIPCHRVVGVDGSLTGFACGLDIKRKLLKIEKNPHVFVFFAYLCEKSMKHNTPCQSYKSS